MTQAELGYNINFGDLSARLFAKYRGLREADLCPMNPEYSCVLCKKLNLKHKTRDQCGRIGGACPDHEPITEEEFARRYEFYD